MAKITRLLLAAFLAAPAPALAQELDSLLIGAATRARVRANAIAAGARPDGGARQYAEALTDLAAGNWSDAVLSLTAAMQRNRNNPLYQGDLGYALARMARFDEAADAYASAARIQGQNAWFMVGLAVVRAAQRNWADAAGTFTLAFNTDTAVVQLPGYAAVTAQSYEAAGDRIQAATWYERAIQRDARDADSWLRLGIIQRNRNDSAGIHTIRHYRTMRPDDLLGAAIYATYLSDMGQIDSALALAALAAQDSAYRAYAAEVHLQAGVNLLRVRDIQRSADVLERGRPWAAPNLRDAYAFYIGNVQIQQLAVRLNDIQETESCEGARSLDTLLSSVQENLTAGRAIDTTRTDMLVNQILPGYRHTATQMTQRYCDPRRRPARPAPRPPAERRP
jgi:tetratricopeptide (TPR) repeat protein